MAVKRHPEGMTLMVLPYRENNISILNLSKGWIRRKGVLGEGVDLYRRGKLVLVSARAPRCGALSCTTEPAYSPCQEG
jgi:hypothetical protein